MITIDKKVFYSNDWAYLYRPYLLERRGQLLEKLESPKLSEQETALIRGQLLEIKYLFNQEKAALDESRTK